MTTEAQDERGSDLCAEFKQMAREIIRKGEANGGDPSWATLAQAIDEAWTEHEAELASLDKG